MMTIHPIKQVRQYSLYIFGPQQIPSDFHEELGIARAHSFSQSCGIASDEPDIDAYDSCYYQIILRDEEQKRIVGGYRLGLVDQLLKDYGENGIYSASLYNFSKDAFNILGHTVELGRSFVHPDYQKVSSALATLWSGISWFTSTKPEYNQFIGMVSVGSKYNAVAKWLMIDYMERHRPYEALRGHITPMHTFVFSASENQMIENYKKNQPLPDSVMDLEKAINAISNGELNIPSILKYYLRYTPIGMMCYGRDPEFGEVMDLFCFSPIAQSVEGVQKLTSRFELEQKAA